MVASGNGFTDLPPSSFADALAGQLMEERTLVIREALTDALVARVTEQLAVLAADSGEPINVLLGLWGRAAAPGLALHDAFQSTGVPVRAVATGRVSGAGVVAFCGAGERYCLPGTRFRLAEPTGAASGPSLAADAEEIAGDRKRMIALLGQATGQKPERIERDLEQRAAFTAEEAVRYGLAARVVQNAGDVDG